MNDDTASAIQSSMLVSTTQGKATSQVTEELATPYGEGQSADSGPCA